LQERRPRREEKQHNGEVPAELSAIFFLCFIVNKTTGLDIMRKIIEFFVLYPACSRRGAAPTRGQSNVFLIPGS
jgi:hypothetical protein